MLPAGLLRPRLIRFSQPPIQRTSRRTFLSSILSSTAPPPLQTLTASRRLPYHYAELYSLIADIDNYSTFLPYCSSSRVTAWTTSEDPEFGRRWPTRADLTAGWGGLEQTYTSRVLCVPGSVVEALSGEGARSGIAPDVLAKYGLQDERSSLAPAASVAASGNSRGEGVFETLVTRWTVTPINSSASDARGKDAAIQTGRPVQWSNVHLNISFQFANPLYGAVSSAVADKVAPFMIEAFVERAKKLLAGSR